MSILRSSATTFVLVLGILFFTISLLFGIVNVRLPGNQIGYEPNQPIAYSHRLHAGEMQIPCLYCHHGAEKSRHAGIPSGNICMNCHFLVNQTKGAFDKEIDVASAEKRLPRFETSEELKKLYDSLGYDTVLRPEISANFQPGAATGVPVLKIFPDPKKQPKPILWSKVHNLPDFVYFDHRPHVAAGVPCQDCHGPVQQMEKMRQFSSLSMGWCVNCHRLANQQGVNGKQVDASIDCSTCHY